MTTSRARSRLLPMAMAAMLATLSFAFSSAPDLGPLDPRPASAPLPIAFRPQLASAAYCATPNPAFTGFLTQSLQDTGTPPMINRITNRNVYGWISNIDTKWACTAFYRYDGLGWVETLPDQGTFDWGDLIHSTSTSCNWIVGTTDYLKASGDTTCNGTDTTNAMQISLEKDGPGTRMEGVFQADVNHDSVGDYFYIHSDCNTTGYYGAESIKYNATFSTASSANRPGVNCDVLTYDSTGTSQTVIYDETAPALDFTTPNESTTGYLKTTATYTVTTTATDAVAGFLAPNDWELQRQIASITSPNVCGTFANDTTAGNLTTGVAQTAVNTAQTLVAAKCYRWLLNALDRNGNAAPTRTSGTVLVDIVAPTTDFTAPNESTTTTINATTYSVSWTETEAHSGILTRSLQRQKVGVTGGNCGTSWVNDGTASTSTSPLSVTGLLDANCYRWIQTLTDQATNSTAKTSGTVKVDLAGPSANFMTPNEATTTTQSQTSYSVAWTETPGSGTITARSLQRWKGAVVTNGTCAGVTFATDGSPSTSVSPVSVTGLLTGYCYRWVQTLTNSNGKVGASTSGNVLVDTGAPAGTLAYPEANRPLAGDVVVTGTATDALSFKEYQLEYGAGAAPGSWTSIAILSTQVTTTGPLVTWATESLTGVYTLRLTVRDWAGNTSSVTTRLVYLDNSRRGDEAYWTRVPFDLGGGWSASVGVASGDLALTRDLFSIPSYGPPQSLALAYSSQETASGGFGTGWISNLTQYLTYESGFVFWHRGDGGRVPYGQVGGTWTALTGHFETLSRVAGEDTITLKDQSQLVFDSTSGALKRIVNRFGKQLAFSWTPTSGTVSDASGRATALVIASGRITDATDSAGRHWGFAYTGTDLTSVTDPAGKVTTLGYDASHQLTSVTRIRTKAAGGTETPIWRFAYTPGKVTAVTDPVGEALTPDGSSSIAYNPGTTTVSLVKTFSPTDVVDWIHAFDSHGRVTSTTDPAGFATARTFDADSNLTQQVNPIALLPTPVSQTVSWTYDTRGNALTETAQLDASTSVTTTMTYSAANDLLTRDEADATAIELRTEYTYDGAGHLTQIKVNPQATSNSDENLITAYTYTANDQLETETDPLGRVTKHAYDAWGNETQTIANCTTTGTTPPVPPGSCTAGGTHDASTNVTTTYTFDQLTTAGKAGLATSTTDPVGAITTLTYDALGRQTGEVLPGDVSIPALTRSTTYDELGNVLTEEETWPGLGSPRTTTHVYDLANRETSLTDPAAVFSTTSYDAAGNAISSDAGGVITGRTFDDLDRVVEEDVAGTLTTHDYDGQGREIASTDGVVVLTERFYDLFGRLVSETLDPSGLTLTTTHAYDLLGRELTTVAPEGTTTSTYDRVGRQLTSTTSGATTTTTYDRAGNALTSLDPANVKTTTTYDALNRATVVVGNDVDTPTLPSQDVTTQTWYDAASRPIAGRDPAGIASRAILNVRGLASQSIANCTDSGTTPSSNPPACVGAGTHDTKTNVVSTLTYDGAGATLTNLVEHGDGTSATTTTAYDAAGRVQGVKDPRGTVTRTLYDGDGRVSSTIVNCTDDTSNPQPPSGSWWLCDGSSINDGTWNLMTSGTYDSHGNRLTEAAPNGRVTTFVYDGADRLIQRIDNDVPTPTQADQDLSTFSFYDDAGRQVAVQAPTLDRTTFAVTRFVYDATTGRLTSEIRNCTNTGTAPPENPATCAGTGSADADTNVVTSFAYDAKGNRIRMTAPDPSVAPGVTTTVTAQSAFDAANRLCRVVENATGATDLQVLANPCSDATQTAGTTTTNVSTRYLYDGAGNLTTMIDGRGKQTSYAYDAAGRMTNLTDALGATLAYEYDNLGRRTKQTLRTFPGPFILWTYDGAGRQLTRTADGVTTTSTYDANGNRLTVSDATRTITTSYDRLNRPLSVTVSGDAGATTTYSYSLTSPSWTDPTGTYLVTLDAFDRQVSLDDPVQAAQTTTYRADGQPASVAAPNGNTTAFGYDDLGRPSAKTTTAAGPVSRAAYAWTPNRAGEISSEASTITGDPTNGTTAYTYDQLARLSSFARSGTTTTYGWQAVPNRSSVQLGINPATTYAFDDANRPTSDSAGGAYASDADGRLTDRPGYRSEWDALGRLVTVRPPSGSGVISTYTYDPLDRLLLVDHPGGGGGGAAPSQRVTGATATGTGAITVVPASGHVAGDVELLFVETANEAASLTSAAGFAQVPGTGIGVGVAGGTDGTRMTLFWRRWNGTDGSPLVADSGNHQTAFITSYQGVTGTGNPWDVVGSNQQTSSTTAGSASGVTTGVANTLVVVATAGAQPDATSTTEFAGWTNAGLASLTERHDEAVTSGNGGSLGLADGIAAVAGASGTTTFTSVTSTTKDHVVIALKGESGGNRTRLRYVGLTSSIAQLVDDTSGAVIRHVATSWTGEPVADWTGTGSNLRVFGTNGHHDLTWTADGTGAVSATLRYDPWGSLTSSTGASLPDLRFQSQYRDPETDLSWFVSRWYAPTLGRFVSEDSLLGEPTSPPSRHLYAYAAGEPVGRWDPSGRCSTTYVGYLDCTVNDFDGMTASQRRQWMVSFQYRYARTWFNGVVGVLDGASKTGAIRPRTNWFSRVDAYILAAIQDGQRLSEGKAALVPGNPGNVIWRDFFRSVRNPRSNDAQRRWYWGTAEQAATDYGARHTYRWPTFRELEVKTSTDVWRASVAYGDSVEATLDGWCRINFFVCPLAFVFGEAHSVAKSTFLDPRRDPSVVSALFQGLWVFWGLVNRSTVCRYAYSPIVSGYVRICD